MNFIIDIPHSLPPPSTPYFSIHPRSVLKMDCHVETFFLIRKSNTLTLHTIPIKSGNSTLHFWNYFCLIWEFGPPSLRIYRRRIHDHFVTYWSLTNNHEKLSWMICVVLISYGWYHICVILTLRNALDETTRLRSLSDEELTCRYTRRWIERVILNAEIDGMVLWIIDFDAFLDQSEDQNRCTSHTLARWCRVTLADWIHLRRASRSWLTFVVVPSVPWWLTRRPRRDDVCNVRLGRWSQKRRERR